MYHMHLSNRILILFPVCALFFGGGIAQASDTCGLTGTVEERITDCHIRFAEAATRVVTCRNDHNELDTCAWTLVTRTASHELIWRDEAPNVEGKKMVWFPTNHTMRSNHFDAQSGLCQTRFLDFTGARLPSFGDYHQAVNHGVNDNSLWLVSANLPVWLSNLNEAEETALACNAAISSESWDLQCSWEQRLTKQALLCVSEAF